MTGAGKSEQQVNTTDWIVAPVQTHRHTDTHTRVQIATKTDWRMEGSGQDTVSLRGMFQMMQVLDPARRECNFSLLQRGLDWVTHFQRRQCWWGKWKVYNEGCNFNEPSDHVDTISDKPCSCHVLPDAKRWGVKPPLRCSSLKAHTPNLITRHRRQTPIQGCWIEHLGRTQTGGI